MTARLYAALGIAAGAVACLVALMLRGSGQLPGLSLALVAAGGAAAVLALVGLVVHRSQRRPGAAIVLAAAGWMAGTAAVGSGARGGAPGIGVLWSPAAVLLVVGGYGLVSAARREAGRG